ncbi:TIM barrel protein [Candidatus Pacearchaeota archaeon]|nr:TIM barrel protein [Candidatus Pacearchaeota archaeon]
MTIKFGPAGLGPVKTAKATLEDYHRKGLQACEISFTYSNYIKKEDAKLIGELAKKLNIELSIHGSYFINLNAEDEKKLEASKKRILDACEIGEILGAKCVVFHPGFYAKISREQSYKNILKAVKEIMNAKKKNKWEIEISPETMGKVNVFGSVGEVASLVKETGCSFCIDFAHILAREKEVDYKKIEKIFPQENWHCHFSGIVYGEKGEKHHKTTERKEWENLLKNLPRNKNIRIINESPTMVEDSVEGLSIYLSGSK